MRHRGPARAKSHCPGSPEHNNIQKIETSFGGWDVLEEKYGMERSWLRYGVKLDDFVILSRRPRKPIPAGVRLARLSSTSTSHSVGTHARHTSGSHVPSTLGIVILFKLKHLRDSNQGSVNICSAT
jgi:hypothetical protein